MSQSRLSVIPARAIGDERLNATQFRVLAAIGSFTAKDQSAYPRVRTIGEAVGLTRETTSRAISKLKEFGYVKAIEQTRADGGQSSNLYSVLLDDESQESTTSSDTPCDAPVTPPVTPRDHTPCDGTASHHKTIHINDDNTNVLSLADSELKIAFDGYCKAAKSHGWSVPQAMSSPRKTALRRRLKENGLKGWGDILRQCIASDFLSGRTPEQFKLSFDWLTKPANILKVVEGNYDNRTAGSKRQPASGYRDPQRGKNAAYDYIRDLEGDPGWQPSGAAPEPARDAVFTIDG